MRSSRAGEECEAVVPEGVGCRIYPPDRLGEEFVRPPVRVCYWWELGLHSVVAVLDLFRERELHFRLYNKVRF